MFELFRYLFSFNRRLQVAGLCLRIYFCNIKECDAEIQVFSGVMVIYRFTLCQHTHVMKIPFNKIQVNKGEIIFFYIHDMCLKKG